MKKSVLSFMNRFRLSTSSFAVFLFLSIPLFVNAQEKASDKNLDLGINITSVLSSFSGNGNFLEASDFPISLRWRNNNKAIRLGVGLVGKSSEFFDNITGSFRESIEQEGYLRVGYEKHNKVNDKWGIYWGIDFIGNYKDDKVNISGSSFSTISNRTIGVGGGPLFGLKFNINKSLYLSSEATLYFIERFHTRKDSSSGNGGINTQSRDVSLQPPLFLYLNYAF